MTDTIYTWDELTPEFITETYLSSTATKTLNLDAVSFMAEGPGRYIYPSQFEAVNKLFTKDMDLQYGTYTAQDLINTGKFVKEDFTLATTGAIIDPTSSDYGTRTYISDMESYSLGNNVQFVVDASGVHISNMQIRPFQDNFDFKSGNPAFNSFDSILQDLIDPNKQGGLIKLDFDDASKNNIPFSNGYDANHTYDKSDFDIDVAKALPVSLMDSYDADLAAMNTLWPAMEKIVDDLWAKGMLSNSPVQKEELINDILSLFGAAAQMYSPLVLDLNGDGIHTTALSSTGAVYFDHDHNGTAEASGWVASGDGLLCMDVNKNGLIDNGTELFGNQTGYANGFLQIASYDNNGDGKITAEDIVWKNLKVWVDGNGDGRVEDGELKTLDQLGITAINLAYSNSGATDNGNVLGQVGTFTMNGATKAVDDVYFAADTANTKDINGYQIVDPEVLLQPVIRGYGTLPDLYISMSLDNTASGNLLGLVQSLSAKSLDDVFAGTSATRDLVKSIMYRWAGVDGVAPSSRGGFVDGRSLGYLEKLLGQEYLQAGHESNPRANAAPDLNQAFTLAFDHAYAMLLGQTAAKAVFAGDVHYDLATDSLTGITGLNTSELTALQTEAKGLASTTLRDAFWGDAVRLIEYGYGTGIIFDDGTSGDSDLIQQLLSKQNLHCDFRVSVK